MTTTVDLALRQYPALNSLEHNTRSISKFLGPPPSLLFSEACTHGNIPLLDWIWSSSCLNADDRTPGWSLTNYLRSDPHYYRWQFSKSLYVATERGDMKTVEWLFAHFQGCEAPVEVVEAAARSGYLQVLRFLWRHRLRNAGVKNSNTTGTSQIVQRRNDINPGDGTCTVQFDDFCNADTWGETVIKKAVDNGQLKKCLGSGMRLRWHDRRTAIGHALEIGQSEFAESLLPQGTNILDFAHDCPRPEIVEKMVESGHVQWNEKYAAWAFSNVAKSGKVDTIEQLFQLHSPLREDHAIWSKAWSRSIKDASSHGQLDVVEWLINHSLWHEVCGKMKKNNLKYARHPFVLAAQGGHIKVMQHLYKHGLCIDISDWTTGYFIDESPSVASVLWVADHLWIHKPQHFRWATAKAAQNGQLDLLKLFQSWDNTQRYESRGNRRRRTDSGFSWSDNLLYWAVCGGHVNVLKWLQENCPGIKSDSYTVEIAASRGDLDTIKWLHANRPEGYSLDSMYLAARNGKFEMVKWLFENRPESRSRAALVQAIRFDHLRIAYWLCKKYPDYIVNDNSLEPEQRLVSGGWKLSNALETLLFLRELYPGVFTPGFLHIMRDDYSGDSRMDSHSADLILGWLEKNYPNTCTTDTIEY